MKYVPLKKNFENPKKLSNCPKKKFFDYQKMSTILKKKKINYNIFYL